MKKVNICVLGNSHTACFKTGWELIAEAFPDVDPVFYPFHGPNFGAAMYRGFKANTEDKTLYLEEQQKHQRFKALSGTDGIIPTSGMDLFLFCGGVLPWHALDVRKFSRKACALALENAVTQSNSFALLQTLRKLSQAPVYMTHPPFLGNREGRPRQRATRYAAEIIALNQRVLAAHNAVLLRQPEQTVGRKRETKLPYCVGEYDRKIVGDSGETVQTVDDLIHTNKHYGALAWVELLARAGIAPQEGKLELVEPDEEMLHAQRQGRLFEGHVYKTL